MYQIQGYTFVESNVVAANAEAQKQWQIERKVEAEDHVVLWGEKAQKYFDPT